MQRVTLIHNASAGDGRATGAQLRQLIARHHARVDYVPTRNGLDRALQDPGDLVVVAGGDGTVGRVAAGLLGTGVPLAILPIGTANNIAHGLGLPIDAAPEVLIAGWAEADRRLLDIGVALGPWGARHFVESAGIGLSAHAMPILSAFKERHGAPGDREAQLRQDRTALARLLLEYPPIELELSVRADEGSSAEDGEFLMVEAMNMPSFGPRLRVAPAADPSDGVLQLLLVRERDRAALCDWVRTGADSTPPAASRPIRRLTLTWRGEPVHIDGHVWVAEASRHEKVRIATCGAGADIAFELERERVPVLVPQDGQPGGT